MRRCAPKCAAAIRATRGRTIPSPRPRRTAPSRAGLDTDEPMMQPQLIGLDWGTTSCRAYLIGADGAVLDRQLDGPGILKAEGHFGPWLDSMIGGWIATDGAVPVILSGMIGSRQGWKEAAYERC